MISPFDASPLGTPESLLGEYPLGFPRSLFGAPSTGRDVSLEGVARDDLEPARKRAFAMVGALSCACPCVVLGSHHSKLVRESPLALRMSRDAKPHDDDPLKRIESELRPAVGPMGVAVCLASAASCFCAPLWALLYRHWLMRVYGVRGGACELVKGMLCPWCALAQQHEFLSLRHAEGTARFGWWERASGWNVSKRAAGSLKVKVVVVSAAHVRRLRPREPREAPPPSATDEETTTEEADDATRASRDTEEDESLVVPPQRATSLQSHLVRALLGLPQPPLPEPDAPRIEALAIGAVALHTTGPDGEPRGTMVELWDVPSRPRVETPELIAGGADAIVLAFDADDRVSLDEGVALFRQLFPPGTDARPPVWLVGHFDTESFDVEEANAFVDAQQRARELGARLCFCSCTSVSVGAHRLLRDIAHELWSRRTRSSPAG